MNSPPFLKARALDQVPPGSSDRTCVLVLGMHRSGTSALTRVLSIAGAKLPASLMGAGKGNEVGHWESETLVQFHDQLLEEMGSHCHDWRALEIGRLPLKRQRDIKVEIGNLLAAEFGDAKLFVVNDPRICRFTPLFLDALAEAGFDPRIVHTIRNPLEVADSLEDSDGMVRADAALLWLRHVLDAEYATRGRKRAFLSNQNLLGDWKKAFQKISKDAGVHFPYSVTDIEPQVQDYLRDRLPPDTRLTEELVVDPMLRTWIGEAYSALLVLGQNPASSNAVATLDRIGQEFDKASPVLYSMRDGMLVKAREARTNNGSVSVSDWLSPASFWYPEYLEQSAWTEHAPFASWIIDILRPNTIVELGTHCGYSYFSMCQAVKTLGLKTRCYAVDTWKGDEHTGFYGEDVFENVQDYNQNHYSSFSRLVRSSFDEALSQFSDNSVDLLHIDGRHFYEDVKHDFDSWTPKLSERAVVLFHDTNVRERDFGVFRFWAELTQNHPTFEFLHGHGLGVLAHGDSIPAELRNIFGDAQQPETVVAVRAAYSRLGGALTERLASQTLHKRLVAAENKHSNLATALIEREREGANLNSALQLADCRATELIATLSEREKQLSDHCTTANQANTKAAELASVLEERDKQVTELNAAVEAKDAKAERIAAALAERDKQVTEVDATFRRKSAEAEQLAGALTERDKQVTELNATVEAKDAKVEELNSLLGKSDSALNKARAEMTERTAEAQSLRSRMDTCSEELHELRAQFAKSESHSADLESQRESIERELNLEHQKQKVAQNNRDAELRQLRHEVRTLKLQLSKMLARPIRTGLRSTAWGLMRFSYRALPLQPDVSKRIAEHVVPRIRALSPFLTRAPSDDPLVTPPDLSEQDLSELRAGIRFDRPANPDISIVIPIYNQLAHTLGCLASLTKQKTAYSFEVVILDDCSTDASTEVLSSIDGVTYHKNTENLGFLRNCNQGADLARGEYLVFLNNDTYAQPRWLHALRSSFDEHDNVGIAGSKLVYPDGRLQEAGGIVWSDGSCWNWGHLQDPNHPKYNYVRDVDYVSGASLMITKDLFNRLNRFDRRYACAYYEDTDLCLSTRAAGMRIIYQPQSVLIHYEGISCGSDETEGVKRYQVINKESFYEKWRDRLRSDLPNGVSPEVASDRYVKGHILIVDAVVPTPDQDSGSIDMINLIRILTALNYRVHFIPLTNFAHRGRYTKALQNIGAECVYEPHYSSVRQYLDDNAGLFDHVILSRMPVAAQTIDVVRARCKDARIHFYTVDLHFLREIRAAELSGDAAQMKSAEDTRRRELSIIDKSDTAIVLSEYERDQLENLGKKNIEVVPLIRDISEPCRVPFEKRSGALFIGGYQHAPNVDAVEWLVQDIWPRVRKLAAARQLDPITLHLYGSQMPERFKGFEREDVKVHGYVADLAAAFANVRLSVAPLRYGAGLKGKIATSYEFGVPAVGTSIAFEGMPHESLDEVRVCAGDPEIFAQTVVDIHHDKNRWTQLSEAGLNYVHHYSIASIQQRIEALLSR